MPAPRADGESAGMVSDTAEAPAASCSRAQRRASSPDPAMSGRWPSSTPARVRCEAAGHGTTPAHRSPVMPSSAVVAGREPVATTSASPARRLAPPPPSTSTNVPPKWIATVPSTKRAPAVAADSASSPADGSGSWPPGAGSHSTIVTSAPALASLAAQSMPRWPAPATTILGMTGSSHPQRALWFPVGHFPGLPAEIAGGDERQAWQAGRPLAAAPGGVRPLGDTGDRAGGERRGHGPVDLFGGDPLARAHDGASERRGVEAAVRGGLGWRRQHGLLQERPHVVS